MNSYEIFDESDTLAEELYAVVDLPLLDDSSRTRTSDVACSLSLEHWHSARVLLRAGLLPSALVVHRSQLEALTRSIWLACAASDEQISKLTVALTPETEQAAKNMPQMSKMMQDLQKSGPQQAYEGLARFKDSSWKPLNSYVHAGIHPIQRHHEGYPFKMLCDVLRSSNVLALMSFMHAVVLSGRQPLQRTLLGLAGKRSACMPPLL